MKKDRGQTYRIDLLHLVETLTIYIGSYQCQHREKFHNPLVKEYKSQYVDRAVNGHAQLVAIATFDVGQAAGIFS